MKRYGARGPLSDPPQLGEYEVVLAWQAEAAIAAARLADSLREGERAAREYEQGQPDPLGFNAYELLVGDDEPVVIVPGHRRDQGHRTVSANRDSQMTWATPETVERANYWYEQGQREMLAKCIAALPHDTYCLDTWYDDKTSECFCGSAACDRALRALEEKP